MASSNRHWPSMFKSKPCNTHHQWQHDINSSLINTGTCHRSPYTSVGGCEERSPEPKPRWNPKPEQIRILETIFNSGMVNPPRDEIRKIRVQLQEYGQVGDANVFYWFQNRKSRSKHKLRHLQNTRNNNQTSTPQTQNPCSFPSTNNIASNYSSSSSSSEKSSPKEISTKGFSIGFSNVNEVVANSPNTSLNQTYFHPHNENTTLPSSEPFFYPMQVQHNEGAGGGGGGVGNMTQGFCFPELSDVVQLQNQAHSEQQNVGPCSLLLSEIMNNDHGGGVVASSKEEPDHGKAMKIMQQHPQQLNFCVNSDAPTSLTHNIVVPPITTNNVTVPSPMLQIQGVAEPGAVCPVSCAVKYTVFINDVAFEVAVGPFNVRAAFGDDAVLIHGASGQPVLTNEWGVTHALQPGAFYYLI